MKRNLCIGLFAALCVTALAIGFGCGDDSSSDGSSAAPAARGLSVDDASAGNWLLDVNIDGGEISILEPVGAERVTWVGGHTVDVHNGPAGCLWNDTTDTLTCEIVIENLSDLCMRDVRTRFHDSTNPSAIMTGVDYIWPGPSIVPNTAQPINESGYCITEANPSSAGSAEGCSKTWQDSIPPMGMVSQQFVFTNVPVGQYQVYLEVFANYQSCAAPPGMATIPAGCFDMGISGYNPDEAPVHEVCITSSFYMDKHEVTNAEYAACVSGGGCAPPSNTTSSTRSFYYGNALYDNFPVIYVDWNKASAYCAWAGKRLPTEAEWEYAARGGLAGKVYPWGDTITGADANYGSSGDPWDDDTSEVGYYAPNGYGLYDVAGNVYEWTNDYYDWVYYSSSPVDDPPGGTGTSRVGRGASFGGASTYLRCSYRAQLSQTWSSQVAGFRCAAD